MWDDDTEMDIKETSFFFRLNFSVQQGVKLDFLEKIMRLFCIENKYLQNFVTETF